MNVPKNIGIFGHALSIGLSAFSATSFLIMLKLLLVKSFSTPLIDYGTRSVQAMAFLQNLLLVPGFMEIVATAIALFALAYHKIIVNTRLETIITFSIVGSACFLGMSPFINESAEATPVPLLVTVPIVATLILMLTRGTFSLTSDKIIGATIPAGYILFKIADLLASTGIGAAFPITWLFIKHDPIAVTAFTAAVTISFIFPFLIATLILSFKVEHGFGVKILSGLLFGFSVWIILILDFLLERLDAFPQLTNFRFGLEGIAILMMMFVTRGIIGVGRKQAAAAVIAIGFSAASVLIPLKAKATLYSPELAIDINVKKFYSRFLDRDGDRASIFFGEDDCDDTNFLVRPGRSDTPLNGIDENCLAGDLATPDPPPAVWRLNQPRKPKEKIILVTVDSLRSDMVFADGPLMKNLNAFAKRHAGFASTYSLGSATAISLLNLFYPEHITTRYIFKHRNLLSYLKEAGYTSYCFYPSHRMTSTAIAVAIMQQCDETVIIAGKKITLIPYGEAVLRRAITTMEGAPENTFAWIHLDDVHDYLIHRPGEGYRFRFLFDVLPHLFTYDHAKRQLIEKYQDRVRYLDEVLNNYLLLELESNPSLADTLFILTGDHGEEFLEHDGIFHGSTLYEETIKVPLLLKDGRQGGIYEQPVAHRDAVHTIMEFIGFQREPQAALTLRSHAPDRVIVSLMENTGYFSVRRGRYKSIINYFNNAQVIFDLDEDPGETTDISGRRPDLAEYFQRLIDAEARKIIKR